MLPRPWPPALPDLVTELVSFSKSIGNKRKRTDVVCVELEDSDSSRDSSSSETSTCYRGELWELALMHIVDEGQVILQTGVNIQPLAESRRNVRQNASA
jgi:hypothetical protein